MRRDCKAKDRIGETNFNNNGEEMTVTDYRNARNITVTFKNGGKKNTRYSVFKSGRVRNPNLMQHPRIGETNTNKYGEKMIVIKYRGSNDVDVKFEDGVIRKHCRYWCFRHGEISETGSCLAGLSSKNTKGEEIKIVAYYSAADITVQSADGSKKEHCMLRDFRDGKIYKGEGHAKRKDNLGSVRLGKTRINNDGEEMTITEYRNSLNITVTFKNGGVREHVHYRSFKMGNVKNPLSLKGSGQEGG